MPTGGRYDSGGFPCATLDDGEFENRLTDDPLHDDPIQSKLNRIMEKINKINLWKDETDWRLEFREPRPACETESPWGLDEADDLEYDDYLRRKLAEKGYRDRNPNYGQRNDPSEERGRRDLRGPRWDSPGVRQPGFYTSRNDRPLDRPSSCWEGRTVG